MRVTVGRVGALLRVMHEHEFFKAVKEKKSDDERDHGVHGVCRMLMRELENFRHDIEADHADQHAGSKAEDIVQPVVMPERKEPAKECREESGDRKQYGVHVFKVLQFAVYNGLRVAKSGQRIHI